MWAQLPSPALPLFVEDRLCGTTSRTTRRCPADPVGAFFSFPSWLRWGLDGRRCRSLFKGVPKLPSRNPIISTSRPRSGLSSERHLCPRRRRAGTLDPDWVGQVFALLHTLIDAFERHVMAGDRRYADDTTVPVLAPGIGKTRTGRLWAYLRGERPYGGTGRRRCATATALIAVRFIHALIAVRFIHALTWHPSAAFCRPIVIMVSTGSMPMDTSPRLHAGPISGATSTTSMSPPSNRRWPARRWSASLSSMPSRHRSSVRRLTCAASCAGINGIVSRGTPGNSS